MSTYFDFHSTPVTALACKRPRSFCQKCRWQVTAKHTCTLQMWLRMKWHCKLVNSQHPQTTYSMFLNPHCWLMTPRLDAVGVTSMLVIKCKQWKYINILSAMCVPIPAFELHPLACLVDFLWLHVSTSPGSVCVSACLCPSFSLHMTVFVCS